MKQNIDKEEEKEKKETEIQSIEFMGWMGIFSIFIIGLIIGGFISWFVITPRTIEKPIYILNGNYTCTVVCETPYPESGYFKECYVRCNQINGSWFIYR